MTHLFESKPHAEDRELSPLLKGALLQWKKGVADLRFDPEDLKLPRGWDLPFTIPANERFFLKPLDLGPAASGWADKVEASSTTSALFLVAYDILVSSTDNIIRMDEPNPPSIHPANHPQNLPLELKPLVERLYVALAKSQPLLNKAVDSVSSEGREGLKALFEMPHDETGIMEQEISSRKIHKYYDALLPFDQVSLYQAAQILFEGLDEILPPLLKINQMIPSRIKWETPLGTFLIGGADDDEYQDEDLKDVAVLIDIGGKSTYTTSVASAKEKQIRLVIDLGTDITINPSSSTAVNTGAGVLGIGIMVLPNPQGVKTITSHSFAQGCGVGGVGALFINGTAHLTGDRYVQGAAAFGVGILQVKNGPGSSFHATRIGQGAGMGRGVGIFALEGDKSEVKGGLVEPDPREPFGTVSLCQGVAFGQRAYSGGGVGIATVKGDHVTVMGSYFAQGCGYWHATGVFRFRGNDSLLQARRYDQGSGVHYAFGYFDLDGDRNRILNWGVGPAYGWDHSLGMAVLGGSDNEVQVDWGAGVANIGSLSFAYYQWNKGKLKLGNWGGGQYNRNEPSLSVQILEGIENRVQSFGEALTQGPIKFMRDPWGFAYLNEGKLEKDLKLTPADWNVVPQKENLQKAMVDLQARIKSTESKTGMEEVGDLVDVASAFSLDKESPRQAVERLVILPEEKVPYLVQAIDPAAVDQLIQLQLVVPAHGDVAARAMIESKDKSPAQNHAVLLSFLRNHRPSTVFPVLFKEANSESTSAEASTFRMTAVRIMGTLLNQDIGNEPGTRAVLQIVEKHLSHVYLGTFRKQAIDLLKSISFAEGVGLIATCLDNFTPEKRLAFFKAGPLDVTERLGASGALAFLKMVEKEKDQSLPRLRNELKTLAEAEPLVRQKLYEILKSTQSNDIYGGIVGLGQLAFPEDAPKLEPFLEHEKAIIREASAIALARLGKASVPIFDRALNSSNPRTRSLVAAALSQTVTDQALPLLLKTFEDPEPGVRLTGISSMQNLPAFLNKHLKKLSKTLKKKLKAEPNPDVKLAITLCP